ncbi:MAG: glycosyltransferase family 2 protein [Desulfovibrionaceae bacterium]|nr:glycosyltransferase family 2 protein [Desulfovibrionaceae bacterium]MBF0515083.1 glycosyltransferase family 2 protein [Desulfovibrionaceae bacterium]
MTGDSLPSPEALKQAIVRHNQGDTAGAEEVYRKVLAVDPNNFQALRLFGLLLRGKRENRRFARPLPEAGNPRLKKAAVVIPTFNRAELLERSLECYAAQSMTDFELIILDDDSTDRTPDLVLSWQRRLDVKYIRLAKPEGVAWRDGAAIINLGIRASFAQLILCTHPEVMPGNRALELSVAALENKAYICCKPYYLTVDQQRAIDSVDWRPSRLAVRELPGFYDGPHALDHPMFHPANVERADTFESWVFGGMSRETWRWFGGFTEQSAWGAPDITFHKRRVFLGIKNITLKDADSYCVHQNHDQTRAAAPRDMDECFRNVPGFEELDQAVEHNLW